MAEIVNLYFAGVQCDAARCDAEVSGPPLPLFEGRDRYERRAHDKGWACWVSRGRRWYCPEHGPGKRHKMFRIYPGVPR